MRDRCTAGVAFFYKQHSDEQIAEILNREQLCSGTGLIFTYLRVARLRVAKRIPSAFRFFSSASFFFRFRSRFRSFDMYGLLSVRVLAVPWLGRRSVHFRDVPDTRQARKGQLVPVTATASRLDMDSPAG